MNSCYFGLDFKQLKFFQTLSDQINVLTAARDEALNSAKLLKQKLKEAKSSADSVKRLEVVETDLEEVSEISGRLYCYIITLYGLV